MKKESETPLDWKFLDSIKSKSIRKILREGATNFSEVGLDYADLRAILKNSKKTDVIMGNSIISVAKKIKKVKEFNKIGGIIIFLLADSSFHLKELNYFKTIIPPKNANYIVGAGIKKFPKKTRKVYVVLSWERK